MEQQEEIKAEENNQTPSPEDDKKPSGAVNFYKEQAKKFKQENEVIKQEQAELAQKLSQMEESSLREAENYKELWEREKQQREDAQDRLSSFQQGFLTDKKLTAIETEAIKAGIDLNYVDFVKKDNSSFVKVETTSEGNVNVLGAKEYVEDFKTKFPAMFKSHGGPNVNTATAQESSGPKEYSPAQLLKLSREKPAEYKKIMAKRIG